MNTIKTNIIAQLQKDILLLQGFRRVQKPVAFKVLPVIMNNAFPGAGFPLGAVHEFFSAGAEESAATGGFVSGILASLLRDGGTCIWIGVNRTIFPPALKLFGIAPDKIIFIDLKKEKEILWVTEEALKCDGLAAVVVEMPHLDFNASRRLQLAVEQSQVTGFILRNNAVNVNTTACLARWKITPLHSKLRDNLPGIGFPRWKVELLKIRNGQPGNWEIEFAAGTFRHIPTIPAIIYEQQKKTG